MDTIKAGSFIGNYCGVVKPKDPKTVYKYGVQLGSYVVDAYSKGSNLRYMNHSCDPNCVVQIWDHGGVLGGVEKRFEQSALVFSVAPSLAVSAITI